MKFLKEILFGACSFHSNCGQWTYALLRVFIGFGLLKHGIVNKFPPSEGFVGLITALKFPAPGMFAWLAGFGEVICGALILIGLLTRPAAMIAGITMLVATYAHFVPPLSEKGSGFSHYEKPLLYLVPLIFIAAIGAGKFGVDSALGKRKS